MKIPEVQKSRKRQRSESAEDIIQEIDVNRENKRRRTSGQLTFVSSIEHAFTTVKNWFFGRKISNSGSETDSSSSTMSKRSDLNQGNDEIR